MFVLILLGNKFVVPKYFGRIFFGMEGEGERMFPMCLVWTMLPPLSFLIPPIGHLGLANSEGIIHDFVGLLFALVLVCC